MDSIGEELRELAAILESGSSDSHSEDAEDDKEGLIQETEKDKKKRHEFEQASRALLAELSTLETEYEIEKSCREQAEAYAAQLNRENKQLKRISTALLPVLGHHPEDLLNLDNVDGASKQGEADPESRYLQQIKDLQATISQLLSEKKELAVQITDLQKIIRQLQAKMLLQQKEANRQSRIFMQNLQPDAQLLQALDEVAKMTRDLEETKQEHQVKEKDLEAQLCTRPTGEELQKLQAALTMVEGEKAVLEKRLQQAEDRNATLEEKVKSLEAAAAAAAAAATGNVSPLEAAPVAPPPPPPPPPLPPPQLHSAPVDPLKAIRQRKGARQVACGVTSADSAKAKAVEEMMARIKSGVVLRPARRDSGGFSKSLSAAGSKRRSTVLELQNLLAQSTMRRAVRRSSRRKGSQKKLLDHQLESVLQRRRQLVDCPNQQPESPRAPDHNAGDANSAQGREALRSPPSASHCSTKRLPGGHTDPEARTPSPPEETGRSIAQLQQRAATLQKSRRRAPTLGTEDPCQSPHPPTHLQGKPEE